MDNQHKSLKLKKVIKRMEDLVNAGFEWMFSCPGFNVEEVE